MAMTNSWDLSDEGAWLDMSCEKKYGPSYLNADIDVQISVMYDERTNQTECEHEWIFDHLTSKLARIIPKNPVLCSEWVCDKSVKTNMKCYDAMNDIMTSGGDVSPLAQPDFAPGADPMPLLPPPLPQPPKEFADELISNCTKILKCRGFIILFSDFDMKAAQFKMACQHLAYYGIGVSLSTVGKKIRAAVCPIDSADQLIDIPGDGLMTAFLKLPFNMVDEHVLKARLTNAGISDAVVTAPRAAVGLAGRKSTRTKLYAYATWFYTAIGKCNAAKLLLRPEGTPPVANDVLSIAMKLCLFNNERKLLASSALGLNEVRSTNRLAYSSPTCQHTLTSAMSALDRNNAWPKRLTTTKTWLTNFIATSTTPFSRACRSLNIKAQRRSLTAHNA